MRIIYVDDEVPALQNFQLTVSKFPEIRSLELFGNGKDALRYIKEQPVDVAFLDIEMPGIRGIDLARMIKAYDAQIRIVFVTAYSQYALDAWGVDATGYLLKPYTAADIRKELAKCAYRPLSSNQVVIETIPELKILVNGFALRISAAKPRELFALLVDRGEQGINTSEGIAFLWPDRPNDASTQSLFRMTYKRLAAALEEAGVGHIIESKDNRRFLCVEQVECDLYRILAGDKNAEQKYTGKYLYEYSWSEERNSELNWKIFGKNNRYNFIE